jgi:hypothetical protein
MLSPSLLPDPERPEAAFFFALQEAAEALALPARTFVRFPDGPLARQLASGDGRQKAQSAPRLANPAKPSYLDLENPLQVRLFQSKLAARPLAVSFQEVLPALPLGDPSGAVRELLFEIARPGQHP